MAAAVDAGGLIRLINHGERFPHLENPAGPSANGYVRVESNLCVDGAFPPEFWDVVARHGFGIHVLGVTDTGQPCAILKPAAEGSGAVAAGARAREQNR